MEAIKKKMQAMKLEKDNAADRADVAEQQSKEAVLRAEKVRRLVCPVVVSHLYGFAIASLYHCGLISSTKKRLLCNRPLVNSVFDQDYRSTTRGGRCAFVLCRAVQCCAFTPAG